MHSDAQCPLFENHSGIAEEAGEGSSVGKQNKDLLLWKDQGRLGALLARLANSCWCPAGRPIWLGSRCALSSRGCCLLPGVLLGVVALGEGKEWGFCSEEW